jgi:hypothetical protein
MGGEKKLGVLRGAPERGKREYGIGSDGDWSARACFVHAWVSEVERDVR